MMYILELMIYEHVKKSFYFILSLVPRRHSLHREFTYIDNNLLTFFRCIIWLLLIDCN